MLSYVPDRLTPMPALVVVLHGCTQNAAAYDLGAGWSTLADEYGVILLFPEQRKVNNPNTCFNWFRRQDTARGMGEAQSIRSMIDTMAREHGIDPQRIYITGLSAGGAMASVMLATYPEVFAGGAIIAGLPYRAATDVRSAFQSMSHPQGLTARQQGDLVRAASDHRGPWPTVSIWQGTADTTVHPANATELLKQWTDVHGLTMTPTRQDRVDGHPHRSWSDDDGHALVDEYLIGGLAHGTPLATTGGDHPYGRPASYMLEAGISSTYHIARTWKLTGAPVNAADVQSATTIRPAAEYDGSNTDWETLDSRQADRRGQPIRAMLAGALKSAGLIK